MASQPDPLSNHAPARSARLTKHLASVLHGNQSVLTSGSANLLLEAICAQEDRTSCVERLIGSQPALDRLRTALRFDISNSFINGPLQSFLSYLAVPILKQLCNGDFVRQLLHIVVDPPTIWRAMLKCHQSQELTEDAERTFAWLLLELLSWPGGAPIDIRQVAEDICKTQRLTSSLSHETRTLGHRIKHILQSKESALATGDFGPGGRHDNDFVDFRQISIYPTKDELLSKEKPFFRRADVVKQIAPESRLAAHLDNQFRLLREDMLAELREDLHTSQQSTKFKKSRMRLRGLSLHGIDCGKDKRKSPFALTVTCKSGLERFANLNSSERKAFLIAHENRNFLKHHSFGCLVSDDQIIAFATVNRTEELLVHQTIPVVALQVPAGPALERALLSFKLSNTIDFIMVETAMFSYEPILTCLQGIVELPLANQLLSLPGGVGGDFEPLIPLDVLERLDQKEEQDLQAVLKTEKSVKLDKYQQESLLSGITRSISLIQGPPGKNSPT